VGYHEELLRRRCPGYERVLFAPPPPLVRQIYKKGYMVPWYGTYNLLWIRLWIRLLDRPLISHRARSTYYD